MHIIVCVNLISPRFLILNIIFRPVTSFVLLRRAYERKRQFSLAANENVSLGRAIRNLLYHQSQSGDLDQLGTATCGKPEQTPPLGVFATIPTGNITTTTVTSQSVGGQRNGAHIA